MTTEKIIARIAQLLDGDPLRAGLRLNLIDGGFTDWTQRLLSNGKERLFVSALGIELLAKRFAGNSPAAE
jgi:hypothetical protein